MLLPAEGQQSPVPAAPLNRNPARAAEQGKKPTQLASRKKLNRSPARVAERVKNPTQLARTKKM
jgi:hypothetical protein